VALLPISLLLMGSITVIEVALVAYAGHSGREFVVGYLVAALSVGGIASGLIWGSWSSAAAPAVRLPVLPAGTAIA